MSYTLLHDFENRLYLIPKYREFEICSDGRIYEVVFEKLNEKDILQNSVSFRYTVTEDYSEIHENSLMVIKGIHKKFSSNENIYDVVIPFIEILENLDGYEF